MTEEDQTWSRVKRVGGEGGATGLHSVMVMMIVGVPGGAGGDGDVQGLTGPPDRQRRTTPAEWMGHIMMYLSLLIVFST